MKLTINKIYDNHEQLAAVEISTPKQTKAKYIEDQLSNYVMTHYFNGEQPKVYQLRSDSEISILCLKKPHNLSTCNEILTILT